MQVKKDGEAPTQEKPSKKKVEEEANSGYACMRAWTFAAYHLARVDDEDCGPHHCEMLDNFCNLSI